MLTGIKIDNFTAFEQLDIRLSKGVNVFIGANGTGKTHLMKLLYGVMQLADNTAVKTMDQTLQGLFLPDTQITQTRLSRTRMARIIRIC